LPPFSLLHNTRGEDPSDHPALGTSRWRSVIVPIERTVRKAALEPAEAM